MKSFTFALEKELFKLLHRKKYFVLIILGALFSMLRWGGNALINRLSEGNVSLKANIALEMLPFAAEILVPIIMFIAISDLFTHEYSSDTMKICLIQPLSRFGVLSAKTVAALLLGSITLIVMFIVNSVVQVISGGPLSRITITFVAYAIDILPLAGIACMGVLINVCLKSPVSATLLSMALYALMKYAGLYISGSEAFLFTALAKLHIMFLGQTLPFHVIMSKLGILFGSILILYSSSYIIFEKRCY